ncbi:MAG: type II/IV secretion system ATPase subunit [Euryarchaeota archaeon]|nr:type II/IV secretion system ATPase subunit [Euryarchaeota archaeon]
MARPRAKDTIVLDESEFRDTGGPAGGRPPRKGEEGASRGRKPRGPPPDIVCPHESRPRGSVRVLTVDCVGCPHGASSLEDPVCIRSVLHLLSRDPSVGRLALAHHHVKEYEGPALELLHRLARFAEEVQVYPSLVPASDGEGLCGACASGEGRAALEGWMGRLWGEPAGALGELRSLRARAEAEKNGCPQCESRRGLLGELAERAHPLEEPLEGERPLGPGRLRPYVRPRFAPSRILGEPPNNTVFLRSYDVAPPGGTPLRVSIYRYSDRPESLYFLLPEEYHLEAGDLALVEGARGRLARHRPADLRFATPGEARGVVFRLASGALAEAAREKGAPLTPGGLERLAHILVKHTAGLGILEDLLADDHIQDIYVNAPAGENPVHVVVDDEECTTNIRLSEEEVEALVSRFRSRSGRPFSEATPVLDLGLEEYAARVSAIGAPMSPRGTAYAFRRHRKTPWTLPMLVHRGMLTPLAAGLLGFLMDGQSTVLVAGDVGAGKTSLLTALLLEIPQRYRMVTIEDTSELPVDALQRLGWKIQSMGTRTAVSGGGGEVDPQTALRAALRLGNAALVLGEVRGPEVKVLYEAMQVGSAGNSVVGTIHGASAQAVYERIVESLGVPLQSFQVTDAIVVCSRVRTGGGLQRRRRVIQVSEVLKGTQDPRGLFADLLQYRGEGLAPTERLDMGLSDLVARVAGKWGIPVEKALENIRVRTRMQEQMARAGAGSPRLLEAPAVREANNRWWMLIELNAASRREAALANHEDQLQGAPDYEGAYRQWSEWYGKFAQNPKS